VLISAVIEPADWHPRPPKGLAPAHRAARLDFVSALRSKPGDWRAGLQADLPAQWQPCR